MQELLERNKGLRRRVLIVDDEAIEREMLGSMLSDLYEISYAENGAIALDIIKELKQNLSLIILDLYMPELDGYSLLQVIRTDPYMKRIPVIVLTSEKSSEIKCLKMGAADFIVKPYDEPNLIRARVGHSIELAEDSIIIHETERDSLTGLFNKEFFVEYGMRMDIQNGNIPMDAITIDINHFHIVNELYSRTYGDLILKRIGTAIHNFVRINGGLACRAGGNSFDIYIPHTDDLAERVPEYIADIESIIDDKSISFRMGVYTGVDTDINMERRLECARLACRKLRNSYTTCYAFYSEEMHNKELREERLISDMDRALAEKQFKLYYQPKYNIEGEIPVLSSAEALVRWVHPEFGMISPVEFIPLFEKNGLIQKLDHYVWNEAAAMARHWRDKHGIHLPVSVNVSRVDVFNPMLCELLCEIVKNNELVPEGLLLEITESAYTDNADQIIQTVHNLRELGFKIEMDDFGCGYSSLNMLNSLPIDALKLDMTFIRNISTDKKDYRLVAIMIDIARLLGVPVIAEGVETKEQMELLKEIGCEIIQGYYFSKPLPADEFEILLTTAQI
ncbi:MAG: EAL domain-containing protein [Clostridia bacterium]|nr:EAL domain-containing protein [Clostridia bacterium]